VKLPIGDVVQQCRQLNDVEIGSFLLADGKRRRSHARDVPPIVPRAIAAKQLLDVLGRAFENRFPLFHCRSIGPISIHELH
jgi:hypothetical protein